MRSENVHLYMCYKSCDTGTECFEISHLYQMTKSFSSSERAARAGAKETPAGRLGEKSLSNHRSCSPASNNLTWWVIALSLLTMRILKSGKIRMKLP